MAVKFGWMGARFNLSKMDLSLENIMKTKTFENENLLVRNLPKQKYNHIELIETYEDSTGLIIHKKVYKFEHFKKKFANRRVLSIHDYDDTRTTSICLERLVN